MFSFFYYLLLLLLHVAFTPPPLAGSCAAAVPLEEEDAEGVVGPCEACGHESFPSDLRQEYRRVADLTRKHLKDLNEADPGVDPELSN